MSILKIFSEYIRSGYDLAKLQQMREAFNTNKYLLEAFLLERFLNDSEGSYIITFPQSRFLGRRAWVMKSVPQNAAAGDLWFDLIENVVSILIPSESIPWLVNPPMRQFKPFKCWLATRPVEVWQFQAWKSVCSQHENDLHESSNVLQPIRGVSIQEANKYAEFFNKRLPDQTDWRIVPDYLSDVLIDEIWHDQIAEWSGLKSYVDEAYVLATTRTTIGIDPDDELEAFQRNRGPSSIGITAFSKDSVPEFIGFRTSVSPIHMSQ